MKINLIFAQSLNGIIGNDGKLPWRIPEDMARFKYLTTGCPVIMGRKTWDSLPDKARPLPGRMNIVMTRDPSFNKEKCYTASSPQNALSFARIFYENNYGEDVWVIGGEQIYNLFLSMADYVYMTLVHMNVDGDAKAPIMNLDEWKIPFAETLMSSTGIKYDNVIYNRLR